MSAAPEAYEVKGSSVNSKLEFVRERFGPEAEGRLRDLLREHGAYLILDSSWYSYELFDRLCTAIAENHYGGDLARLEEVGRYSAEASLGSVYKSFARGEGFLAVLKRLSALHSRFYNLGEMVVEVDEGGRACNILLRGAPAYAEADMRVAAGFYQGAASFMGLSKVECTVERQEGAVLFRLRWSE